MHTSQRFECLLRRFAANSYPQLRVVLPATAGAVGSLSRRRGGLKKLFSCLPRDGICIVVKPPNRRLKE